MLTIEIAKGDILGTLAIALTVGWMGVMFLLGIFGSFMVGEPPRGWEWLSFLGMVTMVVGVLSAIGWAEWWVAQWFIRA